MSAATWVLSHSVYQRPLGDSEIAFLPASKDAIGDMFLHIAFRAHRNDIAPARVKIAWSIIRRRHPLLMSKVVIDGEDLSTARFSFAPPASPLDEAEAALYFSQERRQELISNFMNGPRILSNDTLSYLVVSPNLTSREGDQIECDLLICAPHFIGDGTALHQSTHELLCLLASPRCDEELCQELGVTPNWLDILPPAFETRLKVPSSAFQKAASKVNVLKTFQKEIGGHTFSRIQRGAAHTRFLERICTPEQTTSILLLCKANNVTVNHAFSALCNVAWAECITSPKSTELPMMMYTAVNLRSRLSPHPSSTYWFIPLTYYTIVLPSFAPASPAVFWHRARLAKAQTHRAINSPFLPARILQMASNRASGARGLPQPAKPVLEPTAQTQPSAALIGLSLIGNLDRVYTPTSYPSLQLHSVTTASRLKPGGLLLLEHTFAGKLWFQLFWDYMGFEEGQVERFWEELAKAVQTYLG